MQKETFTAAVRDVMIRLRVSEWVALLARHMDQPDALAVTGEEKDVFSGLVFRSRKELEEITQEDGPTHRVITGYGIDEAMAEGVLADLLTRFQGASNSSQIRGFQFGQLYYGLREFEKTVGATLELLGDPILAEPPEGFGVLTVEVPSPEPLPADILVKVVGAVLDIYETLARYVFHTEDEPRIVLLDSGSPLVVGFLLNGEIVDALRKAVFEVLDYLRFWKHRGISQDVDAALSELTLLKELKAAQEDGSLDSDAAARVRLAVTRNLTTLFKARALPKNSPLEALDADRELISESISPLLLPKPEDDRGDGNDAD